MEMTGLSFAGSCYFITFVLHMSYSTGTLSVVSGFIT